MPGVGLLFAILILTLLGFLTASLVGRTIVSYGETLLDRVPLVRNLYRGLRQLFQTVLSQSSRSFQKVALVEYPTQGRLAGRLRRDAGEGRGDAAGCADEDLMAVFIPNTPNVTAGFLVFVPRRGRDHPRHERRGGGQDDHLGRPGRAAIIRPAERLAARRRRRSPKPRNSRQPARISRTASSRPKR